ncbi:3-deoxy-7-phosphoheptulonate synthase [Estrella lausannensis]|uniref:Phospho-2-dehydro-3-deoxyheptonate aldolase n=1 Tax=Estrella lausannensis TaxID=483423 RepID=A0A0H5DNR2_9BACT|nr:3-deoxy-7-phosphoheptulonate synthase [Estrella lausannensis]CRX38026.1 Phospho-2-dehydro-3-deoxyheptonate aldolase [Estrella lausannensis]
MDRLQAPIDVKNSLCLEQEEAAFIGKSRETIRSILDGEDTRKICIVGPCSIHDLSAAIEYAEKLKKLQAEVEETFLLVMRCYIEKPRTQLGWKGLLYDPMLDGTGNMKEGIRLARSLLIHLAKMRVPAATEIIDPFLVGYFDDLISWGCIGARTSESQTHRLMASGLSMPVAFKNTTDGNVKVAINGIIAASQSNAFIALDENGSAAMRKTRGNPHCHLVLRGSHHHTNYDHIAIAQANKDLKDSLQKERVIIDCSHGNCRFSPDGQISPFKSVVAQMAEGNETIKGIVLESHLFGGRQELSSDPRELRYGVSITDHCLDFETTEQLILWAQEAINSKIPESSLYPLPQSSSPCAMHETLPS